MSADLSVVRIRSSVFERFGCFYIICLQIFFFFCRQVLLHFLQYLDNSFISNPLKKQLSAEFSTVVLFLLYAETNLKFQINISTTTLSAEYFAVTIYTKTLVYRNMMLSFMVFKYGTRVIVFWQDCNDGSNNFFSQP